MKKYIIFIIFFFACPVSSTLASTISKPVFNSGFLGYWNFEEGTGMTAFDKSGRGNTGTLTSMAENDWINGKIGTAVDFDGTNDFIDVPTFSTSGGPITISFWNYVATADVQQAAVFSVGLQDTNDRVEAHVPWSDSLLYWDYGDITANGRISTDYTAYLDRWTLVTLVSAGSGGALKAIYLNGNLITSSGASEGLSKTGLTIGKSDGSAIDYFHKGRVDDFRIYNRLLSANEIKRLYNITQSKFNKPPLDRGLVGYWNFEEGDGVITLDRSGRGINATLINGPTWVNGKPGNGTALSFDGDNDYVDTGFKNTNGTAGTISWWQKPTTAFNSGTTRVVWGQIDVGGAPELSAQAFSDNKWYVGWNAPGDDDRVIIDTSASNWVQNEWHQYTLTWSSARTTFYQDGVQIGINNTGPSIADLTALSIKIGRQGDYGSTSYFSGGVDDFRIFNRALSADEVKRLYNITQSKINTLKNNQLTTGLVGLWSFDGSDIYSTTAFDRSGQGNNGTLTGGTAITDGRIGQAINFNGATSYIAVTGSGSTLAQSGDFSICGWAYPRSADSNEQIVARAEDANGFQQNFLLFIRTDDGGNPKWSFQVRSSNTDNEVKGSDVVFNTWMFICGTYVSTGASNPILKIYLNGSLNNTDTVGVNTDSATAQYVSIGAYGNAFGNFWDGYIDDARIYNRALSAEEVKRLYNMGR